MLVKAQDVRVGDIVSGAKVKGIAEVDEQVTFYFDNFIMTYLAEVSISVEKAEIRKRQSNEKN